MATDFVDDYGTDEELAATLRAVGVTTDLTRLVCFRDHPEVHYEICRLLGHEPKKMPES